MIFLHSTFFRIWAYIFYRLNLLLSTTLFFTTSVFAFTMADQLIFNRKADRAFSFFLIDPNSRVYCYTMAFYFFFSIFTVFFFFIHYAVYARAFFLKEEEFKLFAIPFFYLYRLFWSYFFVDLDLLSTLNFQLNYKSSNESNISQWDFSLYFIHFFGLIFDTYKSFITFFLRYRVVFSKISGRLVEKISHWRMRICIQLMALYFFSGEAISYDFIGCGAVGILVERLIFARIFAWKIKAVRVYK